MIKSDIVKIEFTNNNQRIEDILKSKGIKPVRWAVVAVENNEMLISVSYEK